MAEARSPQTSKASSRNQEIFVQVPRSKMMWVQKHIVNSLDRNASSLLSCAMIIHSFTCTEEHQKIFQIRIFSFSKHSFTTHNYLFPVNLVAVGSISLQRRTLHLTSSIFPRARPKGLFLKVTPVRYVDLEIPRPGNAFCIGCFGSCDAASLHPQRRTLAATVAPASVPQVGQISPAGAGRAAAFVGSF